MFRCRNGLPLFVAIVISALLGFVECKAQSEAGPLTLPAGTSVILRLANDLYKKDAKPGQPVEFKVDYDVIVNGQIVIQRGSTVIASVRQIDNTGRAPARMTIDLGPAQTVSEEKVRLAWISPSFASSETGISDIASSASTTGPVTPALMIASLFEKKVFLVKNTWGIAQAAESVALDPTKQNAIQGRYIADRQAAEARLCEAWRLPDYSKFESLLPQSAGGDEYEASLLLRAGDLDGAIGVYQGLLASERELPCSSEITWPFKLRLHFGLAQLYRQKRDYVHAIPEYREAVQLNPKNPDPRIGLIDALQGSGDFDAAIAESKRSDRDPSRLRAIPLSTGPGPYQE
jgi:hypothetical protein